MIVRVFGSIFVVLAITSLGCASVEKAAAQDPQKCERDPKCKTKSDRSADCITACSDNYDCIQRCEQVSAPNR
ncbi:MAG TPA: hypothetical protein VF407_22235 [Polyangiaceae bacterium]